MFIRKTPKKEVRNNALTITYSDLELGLYGLAILDDENANDKMDYGLMLPKEWFSFSDYYHTGMTRPKFDRFDFILGTVVKTVSIKGRYL